MSPLEAIAVGAVGLIGWACALFLLAVVGASLSNRRIKRWQASAQRRADEQHARREEREAYLTALRQAEARTEELAQPLPPIPDPLEVVYGLPSYDRERAR